MSSRRRGPSLATAIMLLILVVTASLIVVVIAGPILLVVALSTIALVAGLASRRRPPSLRQSGGGSRLRPQDDEPDLDREIETAAPGPRWAIQWESRPPVSAVPFARDQLTRVLAEWGLVGEAGEPTQLVVTELMSNAIDHAHPPIQLTVSFPGESVRVEVHDASAEPPRQQSHDPWRVRGRGLQMVDALSPQWGWTNDDTGKTVWADVSIGWPPD
jgi:anti-sigma regulatory factor (Ser/Thr protein kinase)